MKPKRQPDESNAIPSKSVARRVVRVQFPIWKRDWRPSDIADAGDAYFRVPGGPLRRLAVIVPGDSWFLDALGSGGMA